MRRLLLPLLASFALPNAVNANVDPEVHKLCLPAKDYAGCIKFETTNKTTQVNKSESSTIEVIEGKWAYFDYEDAASGKTAFKASLTSENKINLSFPLMAIKMEFYH